MNDTIVELQKEIKDNMFTLTEKEAVVYEESQGQPFDVVLRKVIPSYLMEAFAL